MVESKNKPAESCGEQSVQRDPICKTESLFDRIESTDNGPADYSEPHFPYVNRSNREHFIRARQILDDWFLELMRHNPDSARDVRARFRSSDNEHHFGALTELYLHHFLLEQGFIPQTHPEMTGSSRKPDFLAAKDGRQEFILEAVLVYEEFEAARLKKFESNILDAIDSVNSPDFLITASFENSDPKSQPKASSIRQFLQERIDTLEWSQVYREYEQHGTLPKWHWSQDHWDVELTASPVTEEGRQNRSAVSRVTGAVLHKASIVRVDEAIRSNVLGKVNRYGKIGIPFVIAVNVIRESVFCDDEVIMEALCGKEVFHVTLHPGGSQTTVPDRNLEGIWTDPKKGMINQHMSGLLVLPGLGCSTIELMQPTLWHHPQGLHPIYSNALRIRQRIYNAATGKMEEHAFK